MQEDRDQKRHCYFNLKQFNEWSRSLHWFYNKLFIFKRRKLWKFCFTIHYFYEYKTLSILSGIISLCAHTIKNINFILGIKQRYFEYRFSFEKLFLSSDLALRINLVYWKILLNKLNIGLELRSELLQMVCYSPLSSFALTISIHHRVGTIWWKNVDYQYLKKTNFFNFKPIKIPLIPFKFLVKYEGEGDENI